MTTEPSPNVGPDDIQAVPSGEGTSTPGQSIEPEDADANPVRAYSPFADAEDEDPEALIGDEASEEVRD